jgi:hypothetical protein
MTTDPAAAPPEKRKLSTLEYIVAGVPMALMAVGGALGGGIGAGAFALNVSIFRRDMPPARRYLLSVLVTIGAGLAYVGTIVALALIFPNLFKRR